MNPIPTPTTEAEENAWKKNIQTNEVRDFTMNLLRALEKNKIDLPSIFYEAVEVSAAKLFTSGQDAGYKAGKGDSDFALRAAELRGGERVEKAVKDEQENMLQGGADWTLHHAGLRLAVNAAKSACDEMRKV